MYTQQLDLSYYFIGEIDRTGYNELTSHQCTTVGVVGKYFTAYNLGTKQIYRANSQVGNITWSNYEHGNTIINLETRFNLGTLLLT